MWVCFDTLVTLMFVRVLQIRHDADAHLSKTTHPHDDGTIASQLQSLVNFKVVIWGLYRFLGIYYHDPYSEVLSSFRREGGEGRNSWKKM